ncbi:MAG: carboxypeptidase regulatory-like domain-containing protein [Flavobacteriales bacterium]|nr:carboxypeptidase regulatory-like domain-containing protein [Flavobacteriales bacterium]
MKKQFVLTALAQFFAIVVMAQAFGEIHGKVSDPDGNPVEFAAVTAFDGANVTGDETDAKGNFRIKPLVGGTYTIKCSIVGLEEFVVPGFTVYPDQISKCDIPMQWPGGYVKEAIIFGITDPLIRKDGGTQITIRYDDFKNMASVKGGNILGAIKTMTSDIKTNARGTELYFRGSRTGTTLFLIDGMKIRDNAPSIPTSGLSSLTVYTGGVPAKYGDCTGGVVVIETKNYLSEYYRKVNE